MSILSQMNVTTRELHLCRDGDPHGPEGRLQVKETQDERHNGFTYEWGYEVQLTVAVKFYANQAQYPGRNELARTELLHFLYAPVLHRLHTLRARAADRDWKAVHRVLDEIEKELVA